MKANNNKICRILASGLFLAMSCQAFAQVAGEIDNIGQNLERAASTLDAGSNSTVVLSDKIHQIHEALESTSAVHHYGFKAVRGQDVLLATPDKGYNTLWKVEYQIDGGEWTPKRHEWAHKLSGLNPGTQIDIRVLAVEGAQFESADYKIVFGSFPHMSYDLHNEKGLLPVPYGQTEPAFLATQAFKEATLEARFTDSKAYPLEGGLLIFQLALGYGSGPDILEILTSDNEGKILKQLEFNGCEGGRMSGDVYEFTPDAKLTWSTRYKVGKYWAVNMLPAQLADEPHIFHFGHLCKRWLTNWSRRN